MGRRKKKKNRTQKPNANCDPTTVKNATNIIKIGNDENEFDAENLNTMIKLKNLIKYCIYLVSKMSLVKQQIQL